MKRKKRHWLWNTILLLALILCLLAFMAHYKNWLRMENDRIKILSGIYYKEVHFKDLTNIELVPRIPKMVRISGFSAWEKEKGIFRDSLLPENKVFVYVDDLTRSKIRITYQDSLTVFVNLTDSTRTNQLYRDLERKKDSVHKQFSDEN